MTRQLDVLCAGAVKGLLQALAEPFAGATGASLQARFGAVGAMRDALRRGEPCDVLVVTEAMAGELEAAGDLQPGSLAAVGSVRTGIAVVAGAPLPDIASAAALASSLCSATEIYFPDAERSTAGAHFVAVQGRLGLRELLAPCCRMFPNGAAAMAALAASGDRRGIGCTQVTEIAYTPGLSLVGVLPAEFGLATVYSAAVTKQAADAVLARQLVAWLSGPESSELRRRGGFDSELADRVEQRGAPSSDVT